MPNFSLSDDRGRSRDYDVPENFSPEDFKKALIDTLKGPVGASQPYNKGTSEEEKRAIEQLKQIEKFNEGLAEANEALKGIHKIIDQSKRAVDRGSFGDIAGAIKGMAGPAAAGNSNRDNSELEKKTYQALNKMAVESVTGHSLHVHDHTLVRAVEAMHATLREYLVRSTPGSSRGGGGGRGRGGRGGSAGGTPVAAAASGGESGFAPESAPTPEAGGAAAARAHRDSLDTVRDISREMKLLRDRATGYGHRIQLTEEHFNAMLDDMETKIKLDKEDVLLIEQGLANFGRLEKSQRYELGRTARELREMRLDLAEAQVNPDMHPDDLKKLEDRYKANLDAFAHRLATAGMHTAETTVERLYKHTFGKAHEIVNKAIPVVGAFDTKNLLQNEFHMDPKKMAEEGLLWMRDMNQAMYTTSGFAMDIRNATGQTNSWYGELYRSANDVENIFRRTGQSATVMRKEMLTLYKQGMRGARQVTTVTETSLSLATELGSEASSTTQEIAGWVQNFNLSNAAAMNLTANIRQVSRATGVTGDNLIQAVQSARALARQMNDFGLSTNTSNRALIQLTTIARREGTEGITNELSTGLMGRTALFDRTNPAMRAFLVQAAGRAGMQRELLDGSILNDRDQTRRFGTGMRGNLNAILGDYGARDVSGLRGRDLADANTRAVAMGFTGGINQMEKTVKGFEEMGMTFQERIQRIDAQLNDPNAIMSTRQRADLTDQRRLLERGSAQEEANAAMTQLTDVMRTGGDRTGIEARLNNAVLKLNATLRNQSLRITPQQIADALARGNTGVADLVERMNEVGERDTVETRQQALDPVTQANARLANQLASMQSTVERFAVNNVTPNMIVVQANTQAILQQTAAVLAWIDGAKALLAALGGGALLRSLAGGGMLGRMLGLAPAAAPAAAAAAAAAPGAAAPAAAGAGATGFFGRMLARTGATGRVVGGAAAPAAGAFAGAFIFDQFVFKPDDTNRGNLEAQLYAMNEEGNAQLRAEFDRRIGAEADPLRKRALEMQRDAEFRRRGLLVDAGVNDMRQDSGRARLNRGLGRLTFGALGGDSAPAVSKQFDEAITAVRDNDARIASFVGILNDINTVQRDIAASRALAANIPGAIAENERQIRDLEAQMPSFVELNNIRNGRAAQARKRAIDDAIAERRAANDTMRNQLDAANRTVSQGVAGGSEAYGDVLTDFIKNERGAGGAPLVDARNIGLLQQKMRRFAAMRLDRGANWDASTDPEITQMANDLGIPADRLISMERGARFRMGVHGDAYTANQRLGTATTGARGSFREMIGGMAGDDYWRGKGTNITGADWQAYFTAEASRRNQARGGPALNNYHDAAVGVDARDARDIFAAFQRERGVNFTDDNFNRTTDSLEGAARAMATASERLELLTRLLAAGKDPMSEASQRGFTGIDHLGVWRGGAADRQREMTTALAGRAGDTNFQQNLMRLMGAKSGRTYANYDTALQDALNDPAVLRQALGESGGVRAGEEPMLKALEDTLGHLRNQTRFTNDFVTAALNPGSIYVHDTHLEPLLQEILSIWAAPANTAPFEMAIADPDIEPVTIADQMNQAVLQRRIETEFAGIDVDSTVNLANDLLSQIAEGTQEQIELMKDQIGALMQIVRALSGPGYREGGTVNPVVPAHVPNFYQWSMRHQNLPNFGGTENYVRG